MADVEHHWVDQVRRGTRFLFWTILVSSLLSNGAAYALPSVGGSLEDVRWILFVPAFAGFFLLVAVFSLTAPVPRSPQQETPHAFRSLLRACVIVAVVARCGVLFVSHVPSLPGEGYVRLGGTLVQSAGVVLLFLYLKSLAARFHELRLARSLLFVAWSGAIVHLLVSFGSGRIAVFLGYSPSAGMFFPASLILVDIAIWVWALRLLWKFGSTIQVATRGRCINCGYALEGLSAPRCPECGVRFDLVSTSTVQPSSEYAGA